MPDQKISPIGQPPSEKKEFLRREEIRTMQKEINKIREQEVQKEREKITSLEARQSGEKEKAKAEESIRMVEQKNMEDAKRIRDFLEQAKKRGAEPSFAASDAATEGKEKAANLPDREEAPQKPPEPAPISPKSQIEKNLQTLALKIQSLRAKKNQITAEAEKLKLGLVPTYERERIIEVKKKSIEEKESKTTVSEEKKRIEQERWEIEKQRQEIEKERWAIEEDIESCQNELKKIDLDWQQILSEKKEIEKQKEEIEKKEGESRLREEKIRLEKELETLETSFSSIEAEKNSKLSQKNKITGELQKILENEKSAEETIKQLEQKEGLAANPQNKREIEQERQQMEIKRAELEKSRWNLEAEDNSVGSEFKKIESSQRESARRRDAIKNRLREIDSQLGPVALGNFQKETQKEIALEPVLPKIEQVERQNLPQRSAQTWTRPDAGFSERIETPRSQEEIARKAFSEKTQELENKKAAPLPEATVKDYQQNQRSIAPLHQKQSFLEKIWVRFVLVVLTVAILFLVIAFWWWYLGINK